MSGDLQEAINNAMASALGFYNADAMVEAVPKENRLRYIPCARQTHINHALALFSGFDSVEDMINANGMNGTKGLKGLSI